MDLCPDSSFRWYGRIRNGLPNRGDGWKSALPESRQRFQCSHDQCRTLTEELSQSLGHLCGSLLSLARVAMTFGQRASGGKEMASSGGCKTCSSSTSVAGNTHRPSRSSNASSSPAPWSTEGGEPSAGKDGAPLALNKPQTRRAGNQSAHGFKGQPVNRSTALQFAPTTFARTCSSGISPMRSWSQGNPAEPESPPRSC